MDSLGVDMRVEFVPMTEKWAREIAAWHYEGSYSFYDLENDPEDLREILDPESWPDHYYAALIEGELVGERYLDLTRGRMLLGLGMRPDLTGKGLGGEYVKAGMEFSLKKHSFEAFDILVWEENERAIRVYQSLGFALRERRMVDTNGGRFPFLVMSRPAHGSHLSP